MNTIALFPGQGSQVVGMGKEFFEQFSLARLLFEEASDALKINMKELCFEDKEKRLGLTEFTQPSLVLVSTVCFQIAKQELGISPMAWAGHSVGEYSALVCAEVIRLTDALKWVRERGRLMQESVPVGLGGMTATLGLTVAQAQGLLEWARSEVDYPKDQVVVAANMNCPGQIVLSGHLQALEFVKSKTQHCPALQGQRVKFIPLQVSAPFHSPLMIRAEEKLIEFIGDESRFGDANCPVYSNVDASPHREGGELKKNLMLQISRPVLWNQTIDRMGQDFQLSTNKNELGQAGFAEFGPGKVLTGMLPKILPGLSLRAQNFSGPKDLSI